MCDGHSSGAHGLQVKVIKPRAQNLPKTHMCGRRHHRRSADAATVVDDDIDVAELRHQRLCGVIDRLIVSLADCLNHIAAPRLEQFRHGEQQNLQSFHLPPEF